ncbi:MAG TPA: methyltransferase domain-containing protein [Kiritimatiellia bacterium]|nr:methyltransferase domain-containing protein [Kiritimatiellia bacterium]
MPLGFKPGDFRVRWTGLEKMDDPNCDEQMLLRTLDQFTLVNRLVSRYRSVLRRWVLEDMAKNSDRSYHVVDIGAGGADISVWLLRSARRRGLRLKVSAVDSDPRILDYVRGRWGRESGLQILQGDLRDPDSLPEADYLICNHVLHHLPDEAIPGALRLFEQKSRLLWLINDLHRSFSAYLGFQVLGRFFRSSFTFEDGLISIRKGFKKNEMSTIIGLANLNGTAQIHRILPARIVLIGSGSALKNQI